MAKGSQMMDYLNFNGNFNGNFVNFETSKLYYVSSIMYISSLQKVVTFVSLLLEQKFHGKIK